MRAFALLSCTVFSALLCVAGAVNAQHAQGKDKTPPQSGVLSTNVQGGYGGTNVNMPWGSKVGDPAPVTGSVSRVSERELSVKLSNNSDDTYAVTVAVVQYDDNGRTVKTDHYSYTLKGKEKIERKVTGSPLGQGLQLQLKSWQNLSPKQAPASQAKQAQDTPPTPVAAPIADAPASKKEGLKSFSPKARSSSEPPIAKP